METSNEIDVVAVATPELSEEDRLTIPARKDSLETAGKRVTYVTQDYVFERLKSDTPSPLPVISEEDFLSKYLEEVSIRSRIYSLEGHTTKVVIPEEYAQELDELRPNRLLAAGFPRRDDTKYDNSPLPEDVLLCLDELPDRSYIPTICLVDWLNPRDVWIRAVRGSDTFASAASVSLKSEVVMYRSQICDFFRRTVFHEWSHLLQRRYMDVVDKPWSAAVTLEWFVYVPDTYAYTNHGEHWAVFTDAMAQTDGKLFADAAVRLGPMRAMVWLEALAKSLDEVPVKSRSRCHDIWLKRVAYARRVALKKAQEKARELLSQAEVVISYLDDVAGRENKQ